MTRKLAIIHCHFNPFHSPSRYQNYFVFKKRIEELEPCDLFTIELGFDDQYEIQPGDRVFRIKGSLPENLMWQKEQLLNILMEYVPDEYQHIAWCDGDIVFRSPDVVVNTLRELETCKVVQMFEQANWLNEDRTLNFSKEGFVKHMHMQEAEGFKKALRFSSMGLAWAARREIIDEHKFFPYCIVGSADSFMGYAFMNRFVWDDVHHLARWKENENFRRRFEAWATGIMEAVSGNVGYVEGEVFHLYHGDRKRRQYVERGVILNQLHYDPDTDIELNEDKIFQWRDAAGPLLPMYVEHFFKVREHVTEDF